MATNTYTVTGMTCDHCVGAVRGEVSQIPGVTDVQVDLSSGQVTVTSDAPIDVETIRASVDEAGYELAS
ncbi:heavy-metal-associated domain-containing protein [Actinophytocola algeriensis]|uniref:Copper ion binding protein n=1 Tax=Actinophytocola algeriensis TaxID=1768010 RepID=A0A7W7Q5X8_9PSEU|nr:heavy metal-associated domain-containing protein [Actinophytocola algeriensis]MBB4907652.1 copper ion binding protein [Actinophytocola algeriensis]MBE1479682.1 copper ion binding protein [Actinophytocola algeriensis]